jgi:hypothetical protein
VGENRLESTIRLDGGALISGFTAWSK